MMYRKALLILALLGLTPPVLADSATALFAGGCFWCMESDYQEQKGVSDVVSGFTGGTSKNPTYSGSHQGHFEAVKVTYNPSVISYQQLLDLFWTSVDPFDNKGQFCDKGFSYRSAIFPGNAQERQLAELSKAAVVARFPGQQVHTELRDANQFWGETSSLH